ncbi:MAG: CaiB/BaiF CoA-transferase family protein [Actinomycetota bacterium]
MSGPLEGLKVIELAGIGPSPYACMLLADLGADILRLERANPNASDEPYWDLLARSRPSVAVNLKHDEGRELVLELAEQADVLVEGFRPGVAERLGVGPSDVWSRNKKVVYGRMTGWGQDGPLAARAGHDINYIALSGALWPIGREGERPVPPLNLVGDFGGGGMLLAFGILAAVFAARSSGEGQVVDAAMIDGSASLMAMTHAFLNAGLWKEERGTNLLDTGAHFYEVYATKDEKFMAVGAIEKQFYAELIRGLELSTDYLATQMDRSKWAEMKILFTDIFARKTRDEWTAIFEDVDACVTPVLAPSEAPLHPHMAAREVFASELRQPNPAPRFSKTPGAIASAARTPGSGTRAGLASWGVSDDRVAALLASGALG